MQKRLAIGRGVKVLTKNTDEGRVSTNPPASLRVKNVKTGLVMQM